MLASQSGKLMRLRLLYCFMTFKKALVLALLLSTTLVDIPAHATTSRLTKIIPRGSSPLRAFQKADAVFFGRVTKISEVKQKAQFYDRKYKAQFKVYKAWKGVSKSKMVVLDPGEITDSWPPPAFFTLNGEYLVYANKVSGSQIPLADIIRSNDLVGGPSIKKDIRLLNKFKGRSSKTWLTPNHENAIFWKTIIIMFSSFLLFLLIVLGVKQYFKLTFPAWAWLVLVSIAMLFLVLVDRNTYHVQASGERLIATQGFVPFVKKRTIETDFTAEQIRPEEYDHFNKSYYFGDSWMRLALESLAPEYQIEPYFYIGEYKKSLQALDKAAAKQPLYTIYSDLPHYDVNVLSGLSKRYPKHFKKLLDKDWKNAALEKDPYSDPPRIGLDSEVDYRIRSVQFFADTLIEQKSPSAEAFIMPLLNHKDEDIALRAALSLFNYGTQGRGRAKAMILKSIDKVLWGAVPDSMPDSETLAVRRLASDKQGRAKLEEVAKESYGTPGGPIRSYDISALIRSRAEFSEKLLSSLSKPSTGGVLEYLILERDENLDEILVTLHPREAEKMARKWIAAVEYEGPGMGLLLLSALGKPASKATISASVKWTREEYDNHFEEDENFVRTVKYDSSIAKGLILELLRHKAMRALPGVAEYFNALDTTFSPEAIDLFAQIKPDEAYVSVLSNQAVRRVPGAREALEKVSESRNRKLRFQATASLFNLSRKPKAAYTELLTRALKDKHDKKFQAISYAALSVRGQDVEIPNVSAKALTRAFRWRLLFPFTPEERRHLVETIMKIAGSARQGDAARDIWENGLIFEPNFASTMWPAVVSGKIEDTDRPWALLAYLKTIDNPDNYALQLLRGDIAIGRSSTTTVNNAKFRDEIQRAIMLMDEEKQKSSLTHFLDYSIAYPQAFFGFPSSQMIRNPANKRPPISDTVAKEFKKPGF